MGAPVGEISRRMAVTAVLVIAAAAGVASGAWATGAAASGSAPPTAEIRQVAVAHALSPGVATPLSGQIVVKGSSRITTVSGRVRPFFTQPDSTSPPCTEADFRITGTARVRGNSWAGLNLVMVETHLNQDNCRGLSHLRIDYLAT
jgi:hypothetical protein